MICSMCKGSGGVTVANKDGDPVQDDCPNCRGTGEESEAHRQLMTYAMLGVAFRKNQEGK
jgi:DnaJ-class molecular chaperone